MSPVRVRPSAPCIRWTAPSLGAVFLSRESVRRQAQNAFAVQSVVTNFRPGLEQSSRAAAETSQRCAGIVLGLVLCLLFSGCSIDASPSPTKGGATLRIAWYGPAGQFDPGITDPGRASSATSFLVASIANAGLVKFSPDLHVIPELAVSIPTISTDGRTYTFTIRQDARYANGSHCTAADVAYSFARALAPAEHAPLARQYLGGIEGADAVTSGTARALVGVRVIHRLTVKIRLTAPDATFLQKLAFPVAAIRSRNGAGGLGPFVATRSGTPSTLDFTRRPHYFGGQLQLDSIRLVAVRNAAAGIELYRKGLVDAAWVPPSKMPAYAGHSEFNSATSLDGYYAVSPGRAGTQLAAALDRTRLLHGLEPGLVPLLSVVPPSVPDYVSSPPSVDAASAGAPATPIRLRVAQARDTLSQRLRIALSRQWRSDSIAGQSVWIVHATFLLPDPGRWLAIIAGQAPRWYLNQLAFTNTLTNDPVSRMSAYSDAENWALTKGIIVPLATGTLGYLVRPSLQGLDVTPVGLMPANNNWTLVAPT